MGKMTSYVITLDDFKNWLTEQGIKIKIPFSEIPNNNDYEYDSKVYCCVPANAIPEIKALHLGTLRHLKWFMTVDFKTAKVKKKVAKRHYHGSSLKLICLRILMRIILLKMHSRTTENSTVK